MTPGVKGRVGRASFPTSETMTWRSSNEAGRGLDVVVALCEQDAAPAATARLRTRAHLRTRTSFRGEGGLATRGSAQRVARGRRLGLGGPTAPRGLGGRI